jgi:hypothetical protein
MKYTYKIVVLALNAEEEDTGKAALLHNPNIQP